MGLLNEINNVNRTLQYSQQKEETEKEKQELKKYRKDKLKILLKEKINELFKETQNTQDINELTVELLKHKNVNIQIIKNIYLEKYEKQLTKSDLNYLDDIYYLTIKKIQKEYLEIFKEEERERKEEKMQKEIQQKALDKEYIRKQQEKQIAINNAIIFLKTIALILISPFLLIGFVVIAICKSK